MNQEEAHYTLSLLGLGLGLPASRTWETPFCGLSPTVLSGLTQVGPRWLGGPWAGDHFLQPWGVVLCTSKGNDGCSFLSGQLPFHH